MPWLPIFGAWIITWISLAPISAVSETEAQRRVGGTVMFSEDYAQFDDLICHHPSYIHKPPKAAGMSPRIEIVCPDGTVFPNVEVNGGNELLASLDGADYLISRR